jgi:predicted transcriptional regulator
MMEKPVENRFSPASDRHRRVALGISEGELANEAGVSVARLHEYEARPDGEYDVALHLRINQVLDRFERRQKGRNDFWII